MTSDEIKAFEEIYSAYEDATTVKLSELVILGLLSHQVLSRYDIHTLIEKRFSRRYGPIMSMTKATVYNTIGRFKDKGLISVIYEEATKGKPTKYLYGLTEKGEEYLKELVVTNFHNPPYLLISPFFSLLFFNNLKKKEARELLEFKINQMESMVTISEPYMDALPDGIIKSLATSSARIYSIILDLLKELLENLEKGTVKKMYDIDTFIEEEFLETIMKQIKS